MSQYRKPDVDRHPEVDDRGTSETDPVLCVDGRCVFSTLTAPETVEGRGRNTVVSRLTFLEENQFMFYTGVRLIGRTL